MRAVRGLILYLLVIGTGLIMYSVIGAMGH